MKSFNELYIKVDSDSSAAFATALDSALSNGWTRANDAEARSRELGRHGDERYYFYCDERADRAGAMLAIYRRDSETMYVSNVVPSNTWQLTHEEYNRILQDFRDTILSRLSGVQDLTFYIAKRIGRAKVE